MLVTPKTKPPTVCDVLKLTVVGELNIPPLPKAAISVVSAVPKATSSPVSGLKNDAPPLHVPLPSVAPLPGVVVQYRVAARVILATPTVKAVDITSQDERRRMKCGERFALFLRERRLDLRIGLREGLPDEGNGKFKGGKCEERALGRRG